MLRTLLPLLAGILASVASAIADAAPAEAEPAKAESEPPPASEAGEPAAAEPGSDAVPREDDGAPVQEKAEPAIVNEPESKDAPPPPAEPARTGRPRRKWGANQADRLAEPPDGRAWMIGLEGVILQAPPLRSRVVHIDPRFVGRSIAMGGGGVFARYRPIQFIGFDLGARTGSVRYRGQDSENVVSQDQVLIDAGVLLFLGRGDVAQFALSGGLGGQYSRIGYDLESGLEGSQTFGSALFRLGAEAEFLVKRVAFVLSFRTYGVLTDRDVVRNRGELLQGDTGERALAPVPTYQTYLLGSAGIAFRF